MKLQNKLAEIQQKLKAPKNQFNEFGKYSYRNCEDILEAVKPLLGKCVLIINDEIQEIGGRVYVKATATIICKKVFLCKSNTYSASAYAREPEDRKGMDDAQITGSTSSYARKYALNGLFLIDDTKDTDNPNHATPEAETKPQAKPQQTPNNSDDNKEWINVGTPEWDNAVKKKATVKEVREHYKLSKANETHYLKEIA